VINGGSTVCGGTNEYNGCHLSWRLQSEWRNPFWNAVWFVMPIYSL
jgi:hypothetical protein